MQYSPRACYTTTQNARNFDIRLHAIHDALALPACPTLPPFAADCIQRCTIDHKMSDVSSVTIDEVTAFVATRVCTSAHTNIEFCLCRAYRCNTCVCMLQFVSRQHTQYLSFASPANDGLSMDCCVWLEIFRHHSWIQCVTILLYVHARCIQHFTTPTLPLHMVALTRACACAHPHQVCAGADHVCG